MRIVIFSDVHIGEYKAYNDTPYRRLSDTCEVVYRMFQKADELDGIIAFTGDLIDKAVGVSTIVLNALFSTFRRCYRDFPDVRFYGISGNHDMVNRFNIDSTGGDCDSILALLEFHFSNFYHVVGQFDIKTRQGKPVALVGVPFFDKREHFLTFLKEYGDATAIKDSFIKILLTHQSDPETPFADIFPQDIVGFDWCFNGHIHRYKQHTPNFFTVGNPLHRNLSDVGDKKGYLVLDTEDGTVTREYLSFQEFSPAQTVMGTAPKQKETGFVSHLNTQDGKDPLYEGYCKLQNLPPLTIDVGKNCI